MKKFCLILGILFTAAIAKSQEIKLVKDLFIDKTTVDAMHYMDFQKIIPFKDSGVITIGYADSVITGQNQRFRIVIRAFSKDLDSLWSIQMPFNNTGYANIAACSDNNFNTYVSYFFGDDFNLLKISPTGQIIYNSIITSKISSNTTIVNRIAYTDGAIAVLGNIFISQTSFIPFIALFNTDATLRRKHLFPASSSTNYRGLYNCSNLAITRENNLAFTFQQDANSNYKVICYDSLLKEVWNKSINLTLGFNNNLFSQGGLVTFINFDNSDSKVTFFKFDSKTGNGGSKIEFSYLFTSVFTVLSLPAKNGNFLAFGNYSTNSGFDNAIDYFDMDQVLTSAISNTYSSRNRVSDACIIGNTLYTVVVRFADQYCDNSKGIYRGNLWLKKFNTDFLTQTMDLKQMPMAAENLTVYPNPFTDEIIINVKSEGMTAKIYNQLGQLVSTDFYNKDNRLILDTRKLKDGLYVLSVQYTETGENYLFKVIKLN